MLHVTISHHYRRELEAEVSALRTKVETLEAKYVETGFSFNIIYFKSVGIIGGNSVPFWVDLFLVSDFQIFSLITKIQRQGLTEAKWVFADQITVLKASAVECHLMLTLNQYFICRSVGTRSALDWHLVWQSVKSQHIFVNMPISVGQLWIEMSLECRSSRSVSMCMYM